MMLRCMNLLLAQRVHALHPALARQKSNVLRTKIGLAEGRRRGQPVIPYVRGSAILPRLEMRG